jgi:DDE superfamily endonuclease
MLQTLPPSILAILLPFANIFLLGKTFTKATVLITGAVLCKGGITVCAALRMVSLASEKQFSKYHRLLSRDRCDLILGAKILLQTLLNTFQPQGPITFAIDDTLERRRGKKIQAKGRFKDPIYSSGGKVVISSGLRWMPVMLLTPIPFLKRIVALPFLTVLTWSEKRANELKIKHKSPQKYAAQVVCLLRLWIPSRQMRLVVDAGYACVELFIQCTKYNVTLITRLRANARLFDLPPPRTGKKGRPAKKGERLAIKDIAKRVSWSRHTIKGYGGEAIIRDLATWTCLWCPVNGEPIHIRLILARDPTDIKGTIFTLMTNDFNIPITEVMEGYIMRWGQEVTHREVREHLGMETQRQWSKNAIARTTPFLFSLYSLVFLMADSLMKQKTIQPGQTTWYCKDGLTFSDLLGAVRRVLREHQFSQIWASSHKLKKYPLDEGLLEAFLGLLEAA